MEKEKLIKALIYIAVTIILCTIASKLIFRSGETLQDYAQKNPELAYAVQEDDKETDADVSMNDLMIDATTDETIENKTIEESKNENRRRHGYNMPEVQ